MHDKLVLTLFACTKPKAWARVPQVQYEWVGTHWKIITQSVKVNVGKDNMHRRGNRQDLRPLLDKGRCLPMP